MPGRVDPSHRVEGQGFLVRTGLGTLGRGQPGALAAVVDDGHAQMRILSLHLPPRATLEETEVLLERWGRLPAMRQSRLVVGCDCNETVDFDGEDQVLVWLISHQLSLPIQQKRVKKAGGWTILPSKD